MPAIVQTVGSPLSLAAASAIWFAGCALPVGAMAQQYSAKPVRLIVPYTTGGAPDIIARLLADELGQALKGNVIVENKPGQAGSIGADVVAKAPPDGYTLLMATTATQSINPHLYPHLPHDPQKDFFPVALVAYTPVVLAVANTVPARSLVELLAVAKANPGKLTYASAGPGTLQHISAEMLMNMTGVELVHVPYKGTAQLTPDLIAGRVSMMFNSVAALAGFIADGKLRAIAITTRTKALPGVPDFAEAGLSGFEVTPWYAIFAPARTPRDIVTRLNAETARILALPRVAERFEKLGLDRATATPEAIDAIVRKDSERWGKLIRDKRIRAE